MAFGFSPLAFKIVPIIVHMRFIAYPLSAVYLLPRVAAGHMNVHDAGAASAVDVIFSGVRLFFDSRLLNPTKSTSSIVFHPLTVAVSSLQPDSQVSISALV